MPEESKVVKLPRKPDWPYYWITRVSARYAARLEKLLKPVGLDVSRWRVLFTLREHGPLGVSEISDHCVLKLNTTTKIVQRMALEGLVHTRSSPQDGRVTEVRLTDKGVEVSHRAGRFAQTVFDETFEGFTEEEVLQMSILLQRLFAKLG